MTQSHDLPVRNPWTGQIDIHLACSADQDVAARAQSLRAAQPSWAAQTMHARANALRAFAVQLNARRDALHQALSADTGRWTIAAREVDAVVAMLQRWADADPALLAAANGRSAAVPSVRFTTINHPYALVGVISPWNFPLLLAFIDTIPALLAGSAVLLKPSEVTPRHLPIVQAALDATPALAPVLSLVAGAASTGKALIDQVDLICFTGSVRTGRMVYAHAAQRFIPAFLELGGKDPLVVLPGSDIDVATTAALRASVQASGQACQSIERIYVHASQFDDFLALLVAKAQAVEINWPDLRAGTIGPIIFAPQARLIEQQLDDAVARGAAVHCGGKVEDHGGLWIRPTVLSRVHHDMVIMREETFGPIMPVMAYTTTDQALSLANDTQFGLSAAVIGPDTACAVEFARGLQAGAVSIGDAGLTSFVTDVEKQSFKSSGLGGSRMGASGIARFCRRQAVLIQEATPTAISSIQERHD